MKEGIHQREMKIIFRKNIHERGNSPTGNETYFQKNIHEKWNSPTKMKTIFKEKEGIK
ncbi:hypothetical protein [Chitinophaga sp. LS1]|uniref:hypothetical protein n=1 Tax=Chitinophaga sp. LS1 TaxID=3051176 RepID=UPI002AAB2B1E|nr:hypothetical protein [Chitinophaga sp. LS1]WPV70207.1 hypothetical protein QQL36_15990 [Chitinophaga sp. LS1]